MSQSKPQLPGDLPADERAERSLRHDHAARYAAWRIAAGQEAVLGRLPAGDAIRARREREAVLLQAAARRVGDGRVRPTALLPLWNVAGFALGAVTAAMGSRAASACARAVDEALGEADIVPPEPEGVAERMVSAAVKAGCRVALAASERL